MTSAASETHTRWAMALAYPLRVRILERLVADRVVSAGELATQLELRESVARYHLHRLEHLGIVASGTRPTERRARRHLYYLTDREAARVVLEHADDLARLAANAGTRANPRAVTALAALGAALRAARERAGVTISDLAHRAGLPPAVLERIECGEADPRLTVVARLADGVGLTLLEALAAEKVDTGRLRPRER